MGGAISCRFQREISDGGRCIAAPAFPTPYSLIPTPYNEVLTLNINEIIIKGAREHNLKNVNLVIPRNKLIVMTGLSGSGKSSLAFDTIYAEGQRRYVESLSSYARACPPPSPSTRRPPAATPAPRWAR